MNILKLVSAGVAVIILLTLFSINVMAVGPQPPQPNVPLDCGVWAANPKKKWR